MAGKEDIAAKMQEEDVDGDLLFSFKSKQEVKADVGISAGKANKLWREVESLQQEARSAGEPDTGLIAEGTVQAAERGAQATGSTTPAGAATEEGVPPVPSAAEVQGQQQPEPEQQPQPEQQRS